MNFPLAGKVAVVTGAGSGIGAAIAKALAREGAGIALIGRNAAKLERQAAELSADTFIAPADIADAESVHKAFARIRERFPRIDAALWNRMLGVNLTGTYLCTHEVLPAMLKRDYGRVINVASTAGLIGYGYVSAYCAAKHGVIGLTRALALETAKTAVTVNALCPGYADTEITRGTIANIVAKTGKSEAEARAALTSHNPQGRLIQPEEVASAVLWLCLPGPESVTGQAIPIAGGEVM